MVREDPRRFQEIQAESNKTPHFESTTMQRFQNSNVYHDNKTNVISYDVSLAQADENIVYDLSPGDPQNPKVLENGLTTPLEDTASRAAKEKG